ncbi:MAG: archaemetzincin family Zn-dependent metalloprotease [Bryobacteraceae bacterium]|jgi:archaemetzincin
MVKPILLQPLIAGAAGAPAGGAGVSGNGTRAAAFAFGSDSDWPELPLAQLEELAAALARVFRVPCRIAQAGTDVRFARDQHRGQFYSTAILDQLERTIDNGARVLGVGACDLYVPVLTFVFGEARLDGNCAVVSTARLAEEFYGLPARPALLRQRLLKEAVHELGHTFGLRHCPDWRCVMTSSHAVERLDVKTAEFCAKCQKVVGRGFDW